MKKIYEVQVFDHQAFRIFRFGWMFFESKKHANKAAKASMAKGFTVLLKEHPLQEA